MSQATIRVIRQITTLAAAREAAEQTDEELLRRFVDSQDGAAMEAIVRRHGPMVMGVCRRLLRDPADADDAFQAVFFILARKAARLSRPERLAGWLFQTAYRTARKANIARGTRRERQLPIPELATDPVVPEIVWQELRPIFDEEIARLPEKWRLPVILCFLEGQTKKRAAKTLGWAEGTLSSRLQYARELLRNRLSRRGVTLSIGVWSLVLFEGVSSAAVPTPLVATTAQTATAHLTGTALTQLASHTVVSLTNGVLQSMVTAKIKIIAALCLTFGILGSGTGWVLQHAGAEGTSSTEQTANSQPAKKVAEAPPPDVADPFLEGSSGQPAKEGKEKKASSKLDSIDELRRRIEALQQENLALRAQQAELMERAEQQRKRAELERVKALSEYEKQQSELKRTIDLAREEKNKLLPAKENSILEVKETIDFVLKADKETQLAVLKAKVEVVKANYEAAEAIRQAAKVDLERKSALKNANAIAEVELAKAELALKLAEQNVAVAHAQLNAVLAQLKGAEAPRPEAKAAPGHSKAVAEAEVRLDRLMKLKSVGAVADAEVDEARRVLAKLRIHEELRVLGVVQERKVERLKRLVEVGAATQAELKKAVEELMAAIKRYEEWR